MTTDNLEKLTERQVRIADALSRGLTIKEICHEQNVSDSTVNKHIRQIKEKLGAQSRSDIVAAVQKDEKPAFFKGGSFSAPPISGLPDSHLVLPEAAPDDDGKLLFEDSLGMQFAPQWSPRSEPRIVPRWLDGKHALLARLGLIGAIACGVMIVLVVALAAASSLTQVVGGSEPDLVLQQE